MQLIKTPAIEVWLLGTPRPFWSVVGVGGGGERGRGSSRGEARRVDQMESLVTLHIGRMNGTQSTGWLVKGRMEGRDTFIFLSLGSLHLLFPLPVALFP